jgi:hypothetical protein
MLTSTLKWATKERKMIEAKIHLKPILELIEVRIMQDIELYGDKGGYCSKNECDTKSGVPCQVTRDMIHD